jgi:hypothetical protein
LLGVELNIWNLEKCTRKEQGQSKWRVQGFAIDNVRTKRSFQFGAPISICNGGMRGEDCA